LWRGRPARERLLKEGVIPRPFRAEGSRVRRYQAMLLAWPPSPAPLWKRAASAHERRHTEMWASAPEEFALLLARAGKLDTVCWLLATWPCPSATAAPLRPTL